jgi:3-hydroxyisobutyrate dehydrogenase
MTPMSSIGWIGTGVMGLPMAHHLLDAGYRLRVHNRTQAKAQSLIERGAIRCDTPASVCDQADVVFTLLGYPSDVRSIYLGANGLLVQAAPATLLVDMTTSDPTLARHLAREGASRGLSVIDAPLTGGQAGAVNGTLSVMLGGETEAVKRLLPYLQAFSQKVVHQGPAGAGQDTKLCNQIALAGIMLSLCEAYQYAIKAGLDPLKVLESIGGGAAASWPMQNLLPEIINGNNQPGFYVKHFLKDLEIALESAETLYLDLPALNLTRQLYRKLEKMGHGEDGTQSLIEWYREHNG